MRLSEPNETRLGFSTGRPRGAGVGTGFAHEIWEALARSAAVQSGMLVDLEDAVLLIPGLGPDRISDIATCLIRPQLVEYTQAICAQFGIPMQDSVVIGPVWDPREHRWTAIHARVPTPNKPLLFVPKAIVRRRLEYDDGEFYSLYVLPAWAEEEISANTALVHLLQDGSKRVYKKDLRKKRGFSKEIVADFVQNNPESLADYKRKKEEGRQRPVDLATFAYLEDGDPTDWGGLSDRLRAVPTGDAGASEYEKVIAELLTALFYPSLVRPQLQTRIDGGRKRIDITFWNMGNVGGFFEWMLRNYPAANVMVECKNYTGDPANPELDQLCGRFSPNRGRFGLLVCRQFQNRDLFVQRCRDAADAQRGFVIALNDDDLVRLVAKRRERDFEGITDYLKLRFDELIM